MSKTTTDLLYLVTIVTFILALRFLSSPRRARQGNLLGAAGMALAIAVTLAQEGLENFGWIGLAMAIGAVIGVVGARSVKMTAMPQMVALFNGVGGGAVALIALAEFHNLTPLPGDLAAEESIAILLSALIGSISFSGSLIAFAKLQELLSGRPIVYAGQQFVNGAVLLGLGDPGADRLGDRGRRSRRGADRRRARFGLFVLPIGGADMPVVISLLNAFTGLAASAAGFLLHNNVLIVAGALVGASGTLLTLLMGRAMNRSIGNVLFGAFGAVQQADGGCGGRRRTQRPRDDGRGSRDHARLRPQSSWATSRSPRRSTPSGHSLSCSSTKGSTSSTDPPRRRPDAGAHERPARRGDVPYDQLKRWTRSTRAAADGRRRHPRRQRRRQPGRALRHEQPDLRDADHRRRSRRHVVVVKRSPARLRRDRQPALLRPEDAMLFADAKQALETSAPP